MFSWSLSKFSSTLRYLSICSIKNFKPSKVKVDQPQKIRSQAKIHNLAFKNSNIVIEGIIQKRKDHFL